MRFSKILFIITLQIWPSLASLVYGQVADDPWSSSEPAAYLYVSSIGSDKNDGLTELPRNGSGPKRTLQGALDALSELSTLPPKTVIVMGRGRYDLSAPIRIPPQLTTRTALKIRSSEDGVAVITGARAFAGNWKVSEGSSDVVEWNLGSSVPKEYQSFSTMYSHRGTIVPRTRFPSFDGTEKSFFLTRGVPFLEFLQSKFSLTDEQLDGMIGNLGSASLEEVLAYSYRTYKQGQVLPLSALRSEAAIASGYTELELANGIRRRNLANTAEVTVKVTFGDCMRQTFLMDNAAASSVAGFNLTQSDIVFLPTFESSRTKLLRIQPYPYLGGQFKIGVTQVPVRREFNGWLSQVGYRFYFENDKSMLKAPGEWFLDRTSKTLYYRLDSKQKLGPDGKIYDAGNPEPIYFNLPAQAFKFAPLLTLGAQSTPAKNSILEGLRFSYTDWEIPGLGYYSGGQSYSQTYTSLGPAILFPAVNVECEGCSITKNTFSGVAAHALTINGSYNFVSQNEVVDVGANGIATGRPAEEATPAGSLNGIVSNHHNRIVGNRVASIGEIHAEGTGILAFRITDSQISDNLVEDIAYTGISLGWGWQGNAEDIRRVIDTHVVSIEQGNRNAPLVYFEGALSGRNNLVERNVVRRAMQKLVDGAGIYVVGSQPNSKVIGNVIYDITRREQLLDILYGIYLDRNTQLLEVRDNFVMKVGRGALNLNTTARNNIRHNIFSDLINERDQGALLSDNVSFPLSSWVTDYLNQKCASTPTCKRTTSPSKTIEIVGHDNTITNNLFIGTLKARYGIKVQSLNGIQVTSLKSNGANLYANPLRNWQQNSPFSSSEVAKELQDSKSVISTEDAGVSFNSSSHTISISSSSLALSAPVSFGELKLTAGPKNSVGAYRR